MLKNTESRASGGVRGSVKSTGEVWSLIMLPLTYRQIILSALAMIGCIIEEVVAL